MNTRTFADETQIRLRPLVIRPEDGEYVVGSLASGEFVMVPEIGRRAIELLDGNTVGQVRRELADEYDADVDVADFVGELDELGFVRSIDEQDVPLLDPVPNSLPWLRAGHLRWLFRWPAAMLWVVLLLAAVGVLVAEPGLLPGYRKFFWANRTSLVYLVNTAMFSLAIVLHELGHLVAARSWGLPARINIGTRLYVLTPQTQVACLWAVPRRQRYRVYLAGIAVDIAVFAVAVLVAAAVPAARGPLGALTVLIVVGVAGQCQLFTRTDLYLVAAELGHAKNLYQDASVYVLDRLRTAARSLFRRAPVTNADPLAALPHRERAFVRVYAVVMVIGSAVGIGLYAWYGIPIAVLTVVRAVDSIRAGIAHGDAADLVDGVLTLAVEAALQAAFLVVFLRGRFARIRRLRDRLRDQPV